MADAARKWSDAELDALERRMRREYEQAAKEMRAKQQSALKRYASELEAREKALDGTEEAMRAHQAWLRGQAAQLTRLGGMADELAQAATDANKKAVDMLNGALPIIYTENANRAAFSIMKAVRADLGFTLVDAETVRHLMGDGVEGQIIHEVTLTPEAQRLRNGLQSIRKNVDSAKDIAWNRQKFTSAITQGILQGESIPNIVKRTTDIFGKNYAAAVRAARTACTSAENAGRTASYERAEEMGIDIEQEWVATLDDRTRDSHREMDGERVKVGERFSNGLRYPGDPAGDPSEVYNCRCTLVAVVDGFDGGDRFSRLPSGATYEDWKAGRV